MDGRNTVDPGADGAIRAIVVLNTLLETLLRSTRGVIRYDPGPGVNPEVRVFWVSFREFEDANAAKLGCLPTLKF